MNRLLATLVTMHAYCRPAGSTTERAFIERYIAPLGAVQDAHKNYIVHVGDSPILWSCHTDTVHAETGSQRVTLAPDGVLTSSGSCLGADDTAGVFLLTEMIKRGIAGRYHFHYGEERGCEGSEDIARFAPETLHGVRYAIALDRAGTADIITHQMGTRTASTAFATGLASLLNAQGLVYAPSDRGMYTDTNSYARLIPECTNLSVGYSAQHSVRESLNTMHVLALLEALCTIDVTTCPSDRDPALQLPDFTDYDRVTGDYVRYAISTRTGKRSIIRTPYKTLRRFDRATYLDTAFADAQEELLERMARDDYERARVTWTPKRKGVN